MQRTAIEVTNKFLTRQGVRNLDAMTGGKNGGYNGSRSASCPHFRDPQSVGILPDRTLGVDPTTGFPVTFHIRKCASCGTELERIRDGEEFERGAQDLVAVG